MAVILQDDLNQSEDDGGNSAAAPNRFYLLRLRFYSAVMLFIVAVGVPLLTVPSLRQRLVDRIVQLREAARGYSGPQPVVAQVGQNPEPFPAQFEKPVVSAQKPLMPMINLSQGVPTVVPPTAREASSSAPNVTQPERRRTLRIPAVQPGQSDSTPVSEPAQPARETAGTDTSLEPVFAQGQIEKEAYNLLLQKYPTVAGMVTGNNPGLQFRNWSAARRDQDTYWVRLVFQQTSDRTETTFIWEVRIGASQVTPLNSNARSLPKQ